MGALRLQARQGRVPRTPGATRCNAQQIEKAMGGRALARASRLPRPTLRLQALSRLVVVKSVPGEKEKASTECRGPEVMRVMTNPPSRGM